MEKILIVSVIEISGMLLVLVMMVNESIKETRALRKLLRHDLQLHQDWLFNQLYSMSPGKVLKADEVEEESESMPAVVINPNKDPMNEFNGRKNDWF